MFSIKQWQILIVTDRNFHTQSLNMKNIISQCSCQKSGMSWRRIHIIHTKSHTQIAFNLEGIHRAHQTDSARLIFLVWGCANKSLARPTSPCLRKESIVSLERGVSSCAKLQVFFVTVAERKHVRQHMRFQQHGDTSCRQVSFPARQGIEGNSRHSDRNIRGTCTIVCCHQKLGGPV